MELGQLETISWIPSFQISVIQTPEIQRELVLDKPINHSCPVIPETEVCIPRIREHSIYIYTQIL